MAGDELDEPLDTFQLYYTYDDTIDRIVIKNDDQEDWKEAALRNGPGLPVLGNAAAGAVGAAISNLLTYPLGLVVARLQVQAQGSSNARDKEEEDEEDENKNEKRNAQKEEDYTSLLGAFRKIYSRQGLSGLYAGLAQDTIKTVADSFLFFLAYSSLRQKRVLAKLGSSSGFGSSRGKRGRRNVVLPVLDELVIGILAGAFSKVFTTPLSNIVTRKQISSPSSSSSSSRSSKRDSTSSAEKQPSSTKQIATQILSEKGITGLWSGYSATLILTLNPSITFFLNELLKHIVLRRILKRSKSSAILTFLLAAFSKAAASSIMYPFSLAKTRAQAISENNNNKNRDANTSHRKDRNQKETITTLFTPKLIAAIYTIARTEGIPALYSGLSIEVLKGFFSHGFTMLAKDAVYLSIVRAYYLLLILFRRYPSASELVQSARERTDEYAEVTKEGVGDLKGEGGGEGSSGGGGAETSSVSGSGSAGSAAPASSVLSPGHGHGHTHTPHVHGGEEDSNATAELVAEYVEDDTEGWRSLYHWFWEDAR